MAKTLIGRVFENEETVSTDNIVISENSGNEAEQTDTAGVSENADSKQSDKETATDNVSDNTENVSEVQKPASKRGRKKEQ